MWVPGRRRRDVVRVPRVVAVIVTTEAAAVAAHRARLGRDAVVVRLAALSVRGRSLDCVRVGVVAKIPGVGGLLLMMMMIVV